MMASRGQKKWPGFASDPVGVDDCFLARQKEEAQREEKEEVGDRRKGGQT